VVSKSERGHGGWTHVNESPLSPGRFSFRVEFRSHVLDLRPGEAVHVPRGVEHRTCADSEAEVAIFEPLGIVNIGEAIAPGFTAPVDVRL
jgi:hypothetical protein